MHVHTAGYHRELRHRRKKTKLPFGAQRFLAILEGVEGGFAIGAGMIVGLSFATDSRQLLVMTAVISLLVNGFNSSAVKYISEHYADELDGAEKDSPFKHYFVPAAYEFIAYLIISCLTLMPLLFFDTIQHAAIWCSAATLITLFGAGYWRGFLMNRRHKVRDGFELMILGLLIITIGGVSGYLLNHMSF
ncbi:MAG: VIT1/CCC1 transporter family protein [Candidatus Saccharimonadales bacterium]